MADACTYETGCVVCAGLASNRPDGRDGESARSDREERFFWWG